ncbi:MAG: hypothetical protein MUC56_02470 [Thermoanaerobaculales bacterium]|nr:hypothetical protein [Thermoanaerobaculales bacterium]
MNAPSCPDHGRLALDLALGRLDDQAALEAERALGSCPHCRAWWGDRLEGEAVAMVDEAVAAALAGLRLPGRRRGHGWVALAAALVMAIGATTLWLARRPVVGPASPETPVRVAVITTFDFEAPATTPAERGPALAGEPGAAEPVFVPTGPRSTVADPGPATGEALPEAAAAPPVVETEPLFAAGFESGDLGGWVPST